MYFSSSNIDEDLVEVVALFSREQLKPYEALDFDINSEECSIEGCVNGARGIIRCMSVCTNCYKKIRIDNKKRITAGVDIPSKDISFI